MVRTAAVAVSWSAALLSIDLRLVYEAAILSFVSSLVVFVRVLARPPSLQQCYGYSESCVFKVRNKRKEACFSLKCVELLQFQ